MNPLESDLVIRISIESLKRYSIVGGPTRITGVTGKPCVVRIPLSAFGINGVNDERSFTEYPYVALEGRILGATSLTDRNRKISIADHSGVTTLIWILPSEIDEPERFLNSWIEDPMIFKSLTIRVTGSPIQFRDEVHLVAHCDPICVEWQEPLGRSLATRIIRGEAPERVNKASQDARTSWVDQIRHDSEVCGLSLIERIVEERSVNRPFKRTLIGDTNEPWESCCCTCHWTSSLSYGLRSLQHSLPRRPTSAWSSQISTIYRYATILNALGSDQSDAVTGQELLKSMMDGDPTAGTQRCGCLFSLVCQAAEMLKMTAAGFEPAPVRNGA